MTLDEVMDTQPIVSWKAAQYTVVVQHSGDWHQFLLDNGVHDWYNGATVLAWLGY